MERKLEIGCGTKSPFRSDFVGLDRFPLPGVDVVCDLDRQPIPFPDNYFDLVYASHALEHVKDLLAVLAEIWRVMKPGAQLCILAPYYSNGMNYANPYHRHCFNEHTPRFWIRSPVSAIDPAEYVGRFPGEQFRWGQAGSDNSCQAWDFRCLRIEFFYYPRYARMSRRKQREMRRHHCDVCHSILYHLVAFKPPMREEDLAQTLIRLYIPPEVEQLRSALSRSHLAHTRYVAYKKLALMVYLRCPRAVRSGVKKVLPGTFWQRVRRFVLGP